MPSEQQSREKLIVLGAGGHARAVAGVLEKLGNWEVLGFLDSVQGSLGETIGAWSVMGHESSLPTLFEQGVRYAFVALGDNRERMCKQELVKKIGFEVATLIHPTAVLEGNVHVGAGSLICAGVILGYSVKIGNGCIVNTGSIVDHECNVGSFVHIAPGTLIAGRVRIGNGAFLGIGTRVIDKKEIGDWAIVGAGSVVIHSVPKNAKVYGVPAKTGVVCN